MVGVIRHRKKVPAVTRICDEAWIMLPKRAVVPPALLPSLDSILKNYSYCLSILAQLFAMIFILFSSSTN